MVDAENQVAGRLSSYVAKRLLEGDRVIVVNAQKALLSGTKRRLLYEWKEKLEISGRVSPRYGPFHPRTPDGILKRMIRGMVPRRKSKGSAALKRLRVYVGVPSQYGSMERKVFDDAKAKKPIAFYLSLEDLSREIGKREN